MIEETGQRIIVIGHKNPDTDSICSAIVYAALKTKLTGRVHEPRRAGQLNEEAEEEKLPGMVLTYALQSYAHGLVCRRLLEIMAQKSGCSDLLKGGKKK